MNYFPTRSNIQTPTTYSFCSRSTNCDLKKLIFVIPIIIGLGLVYVSSIGGIGLFAPSIPHWLTNSVATISQSGNWILWTLMIGGGVLGLGGIFGGIYGLARKEKTEPSTKNMTLDNSVSLPIQPASNHATTPNLTLKASPTIEGIIVEYIFVGVGTKTFVPALKGTIKEIQTFVLFVDLSAEKEFTQELCEGRKNAIFTVIDAFKEKFGMCIFNVHFNFGDASPCTSEGLFETDVYGNKWYRSCFSDLCTQCYERDDVRCVSGEWLDSIYIKQDEKEKWRNGATFMGKVGKILKNLDELPNPEEQVRQFDILSQQAKQAFSKHVIDYEPTVFMPLKALGLSIK